MGFVHFGEVDYVSPFMMKESTELQVAPKQPHGGMYGLFADSFPDGWGLLLQDRIFRQQGILPAQITAMDRLAFVGHRGMGALTFAPESDYQTSGDNEMSASQIHALALILSTTCLMSFLEKMN